MRARAAYISSLGTTGILVAAALMMLALVSALVGFSAWPGGMTDSVASVPIARGADAPVALTQVRRVAVRERPAALRADRTTAAAAPRAVSTEGLVKTTAADPGPADVVKVPSDVHMTLPPPGSPTAPQPPGTGPALEPTPAAPPQDDTPSLVPGRPDDGQAPGSVEELVDQVVGPLPGPSDGGSEGDLSPQITLAPGAIGVTIGSATMSVPLGPNG